jgi:hypothetical protein
MASAPVRQTFGKKSVPFSILEAVEPASTRGRSESMRSVGSEYSDAYPVELENIDPKIEAMKATYMEEQRALAHKAQKKTQKAKIATREQIARHIAGIIHPGAKVTVKLARRGLGGRKAKKQTKKHVKRNTTSNKKKGTKRQPKRRG